MATGDVKELRQVLSRIARRHSKDFVTQMMVSEAMQLTRRDQHKVGRAKATRRSHLSMADTEIKDVIRYALRHPTASNRSVGRIFGIDGGRVSDYLGSKTDDRMKRLRAEVEAEHND